MAVDTNGPASPRRPARALLSVAGERTRNRAQVLELVLHHGSITRSDIGDISRLSKASVSRVVDELLRGGLVTEGIVEAPVGRGRPATTLTPSPDHGHVVGIDMGSGTTRVLVLDSSGTELARTEAVTPSHLAAVPLAEWLAELVFGVLGDADLAPERTMRISMAVPSKVSEGTRLVRPAPVVSHLAGGELHTAVQERLPAPVTFANDAAMALRGEMATGGSIGHRSAVLVISSNGLGAAATPGDNVITGASGALGELGRIPAGGGLSVWDGLSLHGLHGRAEQMGLRFDDWTELLDVSRPELATLHGEARQAFVLVICSLTLCFDPEMIVFTGRMLSLLEALLTQAQDELAERLPLVPQILLLPVDAFVAAKGCAADALGVVHAELVDEVLAGSRGAPPA